MSAYLISPHYCITLGAWANRDEYTLSPSREDIQKSAIAIYRTNIRSLQERYPGEVDKIHKLRHDMVWYGTNDLTVTPGLIIAALAVHPLTVCYAAKCASYQCCEFNGWAMTEGGIAIQNAEDHALWRAIKSHHKEQQGGWPDIELKDSGVMDLSELLRKRV